MTSVSGAGFKSAGKGPGSGNTPFDPLNQHSSETAVNTLAEKADNSAADLAKELEKGVHKLIEESALHSEQHEFVLALEKAKEAGKKERGLVKHREANNLADQINYDLTYAVWFNLANAYQQNGMMEESLNTYTLIVKNKQYPQSGRLRVNMGNIYFAQKKYPLAIKMYRMAIDQIPSKNEDDHKEIRFKIFRNIGNAFVRLGQFQDAITSYERIMKEQGKDSPNFQTAFNLILCYYALGDADKMKRGFNKILSIPIQGVAEDEDDEDEVKAAEEAEAVGHARVDALREEMKKQQKEAEQYILTCARLIAPAIDPNDWTVGYDWVIDQLKVDHENLGGQMSIDMGLQYLKKKEFEKAIELLKGFEKKDQNMKAMAATNLSFIYFLEGDYNSADEYADLAVRNSRYNAKALVNKGNCLFVAHEYHRAKELYLEAIGVQADCVEAIYNLGLANVRMNSPDEARQAFEKLHTIIPNNPAVIYQIANLYEQQNQNQQAAKWFNVLITRVPTDPGILSRLGQIFSKENEESQGFHYQLESYRHYPVNLDVISWLGVWFVKHEMYEKSIHYFERASQIQPSEVKWRLMVTSCYRRMGNYSKALQLYEAIHEEYPENIECLRYLVAICKDLGRPYDGHQQKLVKLDRQLAAKNQNAGGGGGGAADGAMTQFANNNGPRGDGGSGGGGGGGGKQQRESPRAEPKQASPKKPNTLAAPAAKGVDYRGGGGQEAKEKREEDFEDDDVNDLLV
jgi:intraflagellar transport protein 88